MSAILDSVLSPKDPKTGTMITLRMPDDLLNRLNTICNDVRVNKPRARIIKAMIEQGLDEMETALKKIDEIEASNRGIELFRQEMEDAAEKSNGWITKIE